MIVVDGDSRGPEKGDTSAAVVIRTRKVHEVRCMVVHIDRRILHNHCVGCVVAGL